MKVVAGVDTHKQTHSVAFVNSLGELLDCFVIEAGAAGYAEAIKRAQSHGEMIWGLEGTGSYGRAFADALIAAGAVVYEVPGFVTKRHRRKLRRRGKSDAQDAHAIAEAVLREHETLPRCERTDEQEACRLLYDRRDHYVRRRTECVNRLHSLVFRLGLEAPKDLTTFKALDVVENQLPASVCDSYATFELVDEMRDTIDETRRLLVKIAELEKRMRPFVERWASALLPMRGVSIVVAAGFIGHGALGNVRNADAFAMRAGVAPIPCSSGQHQAVRLNSGGNRQLNRLLHVVALSQIRSTDHPGEVYYRRKRKEGQNHRAALRSLKRQLATVVYHRLKASVHPHSSNLPIAASLVA